MTSSLQMKKKWLVVQMDTTKGMDWVEEIILNKRDSKFVKRLKDYLALDSENHGELYQILQSLIRKL